MSPDTRPRHFLTVDVEDWRRGLGLSPAPGDILLANALERFLDALAGTGARATFFVLGEDAPGLRAALRRAAAGGHEVACHGMRHRRADCMTPEGFRRDVRDARALIEDLSGVACRGYRAPWFSLAPGSPWAFRVLAEEGYAWDASLRLPLGSGTPEAVRAAGLAEASVPLVSLGGRRVGVLGGFALRLLPQPVIGRLLRSCEAAGRPACLYLHPYEWRRAPGMPWGQPVRMLKRRLLVSRTLPRLTRLAGDVELISIAEGLDLLR